MSSNESNCQSALPVLLLLDASGSMLAEDKIGALNRAVRDLIGSVAESPLREVVHLGVIVASGEMARLHLPFTPIASVVWQDIVAGGKTPLGAALHLALEELRRFTGRQADADWPVLVLASDGSPTDLKTWKDSLEQLNGDTIGTKTDRFSVEIGLDADARTLAEFTRHDARLHPLVQAEVLPPHAVRLLRNYLLRFRDKVQSRDQADRARNPSTEEQLRSIDF